MRTKFSRISLLTTAALFALPLSAQAGDNVIGHGVDHIGGVQQFQMPMFINGPAGMNTGSGSIGNGAGFGGMYGSEYVQHGQDSGGSNGYHPNNQNELPRDPHPQPPVIEPPVVERPQIIAPDSAVSNNGGSTSPTHHAPDGVGDGPKNIVNSQPPVSPLQPHGVDGVGDGPKTVVNKPIVEPGKPVDPHPMIANPGVPQAVGGGGGGGGNTNAAATISSHVGTGLSTGGQAAQTATTGLAATRQSADLNYNANTATNGQAARVDTNAHCINCTEVPAGAPMPHQTGGGPGIGNEVPAAVGGGGGGVTDGFEHMQTMGDGASVSDQGGNVAAPAPASQAAATTDAASQPAASPEHVPSTQAAAPTDEATAGAGATSDAAATDATATANAQPSTRAAQFDALREQRHQRWLEWAKACDADPSNCSVKAVRANAFRP